MSTLVVAEASSWAFTGGGAFLHARDSWGVVSPIGQGGIPDWLKVCHEGELGQDPSVLQVAVSDGASGVLSGDQEGLDFGGKRGSPHKGLSLSVVEDPSHACLGRVGCSQEGRLLGDQLGQVCRS